MTMPSTPTGTLMKKIQLQFAFSVSTPPTSGPIASAIAETPAQMPIAVPRCLGGKVAVMMPSVAGFMIAAPTPWTVARADQEAGVRREPAGERRAGEDREADHEEPARP